MHLILSVRDRLQRTLCLFWTFSLVARKKGRDRGPDVHSVTGSVPAAISPSHWSFSFAVALRLDQAPGHKAPAGWQLRCGDKARTP
eukprot:SAG31_NODE_17198_length_679_cov_1.241379_1_plen_85_part_01